MRYSSLLCLSVLAAAPLHAQLAPDAKIPQVYLGGSFIVAQPQQEFGDHVNTSFGGSMNVRWAPHNSALSLRSEIGAIGYGNESKRVLLSPTIGGRVMGRLTTSNFIAFAHAGPQLT